MIYAKKEAARYVTCTSMLEQQGHDTARCDRSFGQGRYQQIGTRDAQPKHFLRHDLTSSLSILIRQTSSSPLR